MRSVARGFGAEGIGLCRTEHMFFEGDRIDAVREMIVAEIAGRAQAPRWPRSLPLQQSDFEGIFEAMDGFPVTIRTLDPPLHEFLPHGDAEIDELAKKLGIEAKKLHAHDRELARGQPDARLPRLPAGHHLPRDHRDAGARDLPGRGGSVRSAASRFTPKS